jgi:hypothetical protein
MTWVPGSFQAATPPVWSPWLWVRMMSLTGPAETARSRPRCRAALVGNDVSMMTLPALVVTMKVLPKPLAWKMRPPENSSALV